MLFGDDYQLAMAERARITRTVIEARDEPDRRFRRIRIETQRSLPAPIAKLLGRSNLSYELQETYEDATMTMTWRVIPSALADRITAEGVYQLVASDEPGGCIRIVEGRVEVTLPVVGKRIEKLIGSELESSYEKGTDFAREWMLENA